MSVGYNEEHDAHYFFEDIEPHLRQYKPTEVAWNWYFRYILPAQEFETWTSEVGESSIPSKMVVLIYRQVHGENSLQ